jgi:alpha-tubulin suppressor-like RCC1 family protein
MVVSTLGKIYVWGSGENGQLGLGKEIKESIVPIQVGLDTEFENEVVVDAQCGN